MKVYYIEQLPEDKFNAFCVEMNDRHKIWTAHPNAREISKKDYFDLKNLITEQTKDLNDKCVQ